MASGDTLPYSCVVIDCSSRDFANSASLCLQSHSDAKRTTVINQLKHKWITSEDPRCVFPALSVRTTLDVFLSVKNFPPGSEIIMSAINIPDMVAVVHHHRLKVVALDVSTDTMSPREEWLDSLVTDKTVALLLAHVYGKWFDMEPFVRCARKHNLSLIEDCAEGFSGFNRLGSPAADISLFSFGIIKFYTAFGGAVAKVKDPKVYHKMNMLYESFPIQSQTDYLQKVLKYWVLFCIVNKPSVTGTCQKLGWALNMDYKARFVSALRGFPKNLITKLRQQPSQALLQTMLNRFNSFSMSEIDLATLKGKYVNDRLPENLVMHVGNKAKVNNFWLCPVAVEYPEEVTKAMNAEGIDVYRGATQLALVEPDNGQNDMKHLDTFVSRYPHEARYLIDHVIYLPVNKFVPFKDLDRICDTLVAILNNLHSKGQHSGMGGAKVQSKL